MAFVDKERFKNPIFLKQMVRPFNALFFSPSNNFAPCVPPGWLRDANVMISVDLLWYFALNQLQVSNLKELPNLIDHYEIKSSGEKRKIVPVGSLHHQPAEHVPLSFGLVSFVHVMNIEIGKLKIGTGKINFDDLRKITFSDYFLGAPDNLLTIDQDNEAFKKRIRDLSKIGLAECQLPPLYNNDIPNDKPQTWCSPAYRTYLLGHFIDYSLKVLHAYCAVVLGAKSDIDMPSEIRISQQKLFTAFFESMGRQDLIICNLPTKPPTALNSACKPPGPPL